MSTVKKLFLWKLLHPWKKYTPNKKKDVKLGMQDSYNRVRKK